MLPDRVRLQTLLSRNGSLLLAVVSSLGAGLVAFSCESSETDLPPDTGTGNASTTGIGGTSAGGSGPGGSVIGGFTPEANPCEGHASELICESNVAITCDATGHVSGEQDCELEVCVEGTGCVLCIAGQFHCEGNALSSCNAGPPPAWEPVTTCTMTQKCNATQGSCQPLSPIGNGPDAPTGDYYQYAIFSQSDSPFLGGYDVDCLGNYVYVNRNGPLDVYTVELLDSDGDGKIEPNQHPDNPDDPGPIETRVLTFVTTYQAGLGSWSASEVFAAQDRIFLLNGQGSQGPGAVSEYVFGSGVTTQVLHPTTSIGISQLGFDEVDGRWYGSSEAARRVYSYHEPSASWVPEFEYPNLAGDHMDGLEVITDPNTGISYVYVSDMTSDFLGQYRRDRDGTWVQVNLFQYADVTGQYVEGMGFGTLNHFWATSGNLLYEIGGGDLSKYTEPELPPQ